MLDSGFRICHFDNFILRISGLHRQLHLKQRAAKPQDSERTTFRSRPSCRCAIKRVRRGRSASRSVQICGGRRRDCRHCVLCHTSLCHRSILHIFQVQTENCQGEKAFSHETCMSSFFECHFVFFRMPIGTE